MDLGGTVSLTMLYSMGGELPGKQGQKSCTVLPFLFLPSPLHLLQGRPYLTPWASILLSYGPIPCVQ